MRKFLAAAIASVLVATSAFVLMPSSAASNALPTEWHSRITCTTNSNGYCTGIKHPLGLVPVIQVTPDSITAIVLTSQVTTKDFRVRVMQNTAASWANKTVTLSVSAFAPTDTSTSPTPSASTSPSPSATPSVSVSPSASVTLSTSPSPSVPPVVATDYPTKSNTGVPTGTALTAVSGDVVVTAANTVIEGKKISGNVDVRAAGVVIRNSEIAGIVVNDNTANHYAFTIENSTVGPANSCSSWGNGAIGTKNYTAKNVLVRGFGDGFRIAGGDVLIKDSYVELCTTNPDAHSDGIQAYGAADGKNIVIDHNVIDQRNVLDGTATAPLFIPNDGANQGNQNIQVTVTNNVLAGGGFSLRVYGDLPWTSPSISNNKIVDGTWAYGPVDVTCSKISEWVGNSVVSYDFAAGAVTREVRSLDSAC